MLGLLVPEPVFTVVLCPDIEIIKARESARIKTGYPGFDIETLCNVFMATTPRVGLWIDNGRLTPEQTVELILKEANL